MASSPATYSSCVAGTPLAARCSVLALSERARSALQQPDHRAWQRLRERVDRVVAADIATIESVGGGSVRCMLAEVPASQA